MGIPPPPRVGTVAVIHVRVPSAGVGSGAREHLTIFYEIGSCESLPSLKHEKYEDISLC